MGTGTGGTADGPPGGGVTATTGGVGSGRLTGEDWPVTGVATSTYSRQKAALEVLCDRVADRVHLVRLRPALIFQRSSAAASWSGVARAIARASCSAASITSAVGSAGAPGRARQAGHAECCTTLYAHLHAGQWR